MGLKSHTVNSYHCSIRHFSCLSTHIFNKIWLNKHFLLATLGYIIYLFIYFYQCGSITFKVMIEINPFCNTNIFVLKCIHLQHNPCGQLPTVKVRPLKSAMSSQCRIWCNLDTRHVQKYYTLNKLQYSASKGLICSEVRFPA